MQSILRFFATLALLTATAAAQKPADSAPDVPGLPRVLIIGDSISMGYTPGVQEALAGKANVHRIPGNGASSNNGVKKIDGWLAGGKWDVIHFNFGLWDAKQLPEGEQHSDPDVYEKNLRQIVQRLRATGAKLIWATITPVPDGGKLSPARRFDDIAIYNTIAKKVMAENGVTIDDLNAVVLPQLADIQIPHDVHYKPEGSKLLAGKVAASITARLAEK